MSKFCIVENPGMDDERVVKDGLTYQQAVNHLRKYDSTEEVKADIMRVCQDGTLSTEF